MPLSLAAKMPASLQAKGTQWVPLFYATRKRLMILVGQTD